MDASACARSWTALTWAKSASSSPALKGKKASLRRSQERAVDHRGLSDRRAHGPVLPAIEREVRVAVARHRRIPWPRLHDALAANQHHELDEIELSIGPPLAHGVLMWPPWHRLR